MSRINSQRKSCIDVFNAFLVAFATYVGLFEFPIIKPTYDILNRLIAFQRQYHVRITISGFIFMKMITYLNAYGEILRST